MDLTTSLIETEIDRLLAEIQRYLAVVDALRSEGIEPSWTPELAPRPKRRRTMRP
jgi:hypothetical protein